MEFWNKCSEKLENKLSQDDFNTWIRPLKGNLNKNTLELVAPNDFIANYVETNLANQIIGIVKSQSKKDISLVFKTHTKETFVDKYKNDTKSEDTKLVPSYVFETFVEGKSNHVALAASKQVASNPKGDYNPLFIYGGVGLGKTHLMHAVGNEILRNEPEKRIVYVHSEKFVSDMVKALQLGAMNEFKSFYRNADALLIDDIQFFAGKEQSQEEFFHTFNALLDRNNQMILTCDKYPKEIDGLEERLKSAVVRINPDIPSQTINNSISQILNPNIPGLLNCNREMHKWMMKGLKLTFMEDNQEVGKQLKLIDFENIDNNDWLVVNQFEIQGDQRLRRPDVLVFVNGLPLAVIELKNPADENADIWKAY